MLIISWNVAGWSSTSRMIREDFGSIAAFLQLTGADIVCLQEVKGSLEKLGVDPFSMGASDSGSLGVDGWESFWSFSGRTHRGFNGACTFARKGLTWWCDSQPFTHEDDDRAGELNDEGRVVVTGHSAFVVVNTYVVNARHGLRSAFKKRFFSALKSLLVRLKQTTGLPVILLGDLNQTYRAEDAFWSLRRLSLFAVLQLSRRTQETPDDEWQESFPSLPVTAVRRLEVFIAREVFMLLVEALENRETRGPKSISVDSRILDGQIDDVIESNDTPLMRLKHRVRKGREEHMGEEVTLAELCDAGLRTVFVDALTRPQLASHNRELFALVQYCGLPPHEEASVQFMKQLLTELSLYDALLIQDQRNSSSNVCPCPYTCWDQSRNKRMTNEGTRIDYILIDEALVPSLVPCRRTENNVGVFASVDVATEQGERSGREEEEKSEGNESPPSFFDEFNGRSMSIGIRRSTAGGLYPAAPFDGSGLPPLSVAAKGLQFRGLPSTGMFVTPPQYSDHCGVSAYFEGIFLALRPGKVEERHRCMYRPPVSLHTFFAKRPRQEGMPTVAKGAAVEKREVESRVNLPVSHPKNGGGRHSVAVFDICDDDQSRDTDDSH